METPLIIEGVKFMVLGMGTVFLFLVIMILAMLLQRKIITRCFPEPNQGSVPVPEQKSTASTGDAHKKVAAISAAIQHHNRSK
jgi:oxaloacetate decarboxylase gamma subunit